MAFTRKVLAFQQLELTKGDVYAPSGVIGLVHNVVFCNSHSADVDVIVYYHDGANEFQVMRMTLASGEFAVIQYPGEGDVIADGAKITAEASVADVVTIKVCGSEES